ncbi:MAG: hypothetical protein Q8O88_03535 [bacterium]|nr:hypothetical protein [bacterium]
MKQKTKAILTLILWAVISLFMILNSGCKKEPNNFGPGIGTAPILFKNNDSVIFNAGIATCTVQPTKLDTNYWPCYQILINSTLKVDSFYLDAIRPGYPSYYLDMYAYYSQGPKFLYSNAVGCTPEYITYDEPMYQVWLQPTLLLNGEGVLQISAPNGGTVEFFGWKIATSKK